MPISIGGLRFWSKELRLFENLKSAFLANGLKIMLAGFAVSAIGIVFYIKMQYGNPGLRKIAFATTCAGIVIYLAGRVCVALDRRKQRRQRERRALNSEDDAA
jgi:hypothetical protein